MPTSRKRPITIGSIDDLLASFFVGVPPDYRFETMRLQVYPIAYFLPFLRVPTPLNSAPYSYIILQHTGRGVVQVNAEIVTIRSRAAMVVNRGSIVSLQALHPSTTGWMIMYDEAIVARVLRPHTIERMVGLRSPISLSAGTSRWADELCRLLEEETGVEIGQQQPVSEYLFGALLERLLAEQGEAAPRGADRAEVLEARFRRLVFEHAVAEGTVGFYARKLNVSENYLLRCVSGCSGRSPKEWITDVRLMHAQKLLRATDATIAEIAARSGFDDPSYFGRIFRERFGMTPREFRTMPMQDSSE